MAKTIWIPELCGNTTEYDSFWSEQITLNTSNPDLTRCFQSTVLVSSSSSLMILGGTVMVVYYAKQEPLFTRRNKSKLNWSKLILTLCILLCIFVALCKEVWNLVFHRSTVLPVDVLSKSMQMLAAGLAVYLIHIEYKNGVHTSALQQGYWTAVVICSVVAVRSSYLQAAYDPAVPDSATYSFLYIYFVLAFIVWILSFFPDASLVKDRHQHDSDKIPLRSKPTATQRKTQTEDVKPCPLTYVSFILDLTFMWFLRYIIKGWKRPLQFEDLTDLMPDDKCEHLVPMFNKNWEKELQQYNLIRKNEADSVKSKDKDVRNVNPSLVKPLVFTVAVKLLAFFFFQTVAVSINFLNPLLLSLLLSYIESGDPYFWKGYAIALAILCVTTTAVLLMHRSLVLGRVLGMNIRSVIMSVIYRKMFRLSTAARKKTSMGEITNLMSVDAQKLQDAMVVTPVLWTLPITIAICSTLLYQIIGLSGLAGVVILAIFIPVVGWVCSKKIHQLMGIQMKWKDKRVKTVGEILSGIRVLKLYSWEKPFEEKVKQYRNEEVHKIKRINVIDGLSFTLGSTSSYLVIFIIFMVYLLSSSDHSLDPGKVFVTFALVNTLNFPLTNLPLAINYAGQAFVALKRIKRFLLLEESLDDVTRTPNFSYAVKIEDGTFSWDTADKPTLKNINITVSPGELVAVVGPVGSGKSSLASALLGEMIQMNGIVNVDGSISYVPQHAWILNMSVRNNIFFGKDKNDSKYEAVVGACALHTDLNILPGGDLTEIGEKGINLSGGQKQRVSLARAVYQNRDIYVLDDPLSAVDAHVGKHIFHSVIGPRGMLKNKTRILITHGETYLPYVDRIIVMKNGEITNTGSYNEIKTDDGFCVGDSTGNSFADLEGSDTTEESPVLQGPEKMHTLQMDSGAKKTNKDAVPLKLIKRETEDVGNIKLDVIKSYCLAGGKLQIVLTVFFNLSFLLCLIFGQIWLSKWSTDQQHLNQTEQSQLQSFRLCVYGGIIFAQTSCLLLMCVALAFGCTLAARVFHSRIIARLLKAPMAFFDTTPLGRIMNRCSKDVDSLDVNIPINLRLLLYQLNPLLATVVLISYSTPLFLVVVLPLTIIYILIQRAYIRTARQLRRIDSVKKSPVFSHYQESVSGVTSIKAYQKVDEFIAKCDQLIDESQRSCYLLNISQRWLGVTLDFLGEIVTVTAACLAVLHRFEIGAGIAGLSVSFSLQVSMCLTYFVRAATELETYMVAAERIKEYSEIKTEADYEIPETQPDATWPSKGVIEYQKYSTKYRKELDLVLKDISFHINGGEKIGIVGRTGAGKSSIALSLFRIIESFSGAICIDGVPISSLGLHDLRSKLTVIPQDPVVFSGSLRFNIDPTGQASDSQIWQAVEQSYLRPFVLDTEERLDYECGENGERLSVGQRQLVCLARALLRKSKILLLDEATSGVDLKTDELIQATIRSAFKECTVITIAHRINTILDYDRVMVLDDGRVVESGTPSALLENKSSVFRSLVSHVTVSHKKLNK